MDDNVFHGAVLAVGSVAVAALCWLVKQGSAWLTQRTKSVALGSFYGRVDQLAEKVVKDVYQSTVVGLQASGDWTAQTQKVAKEQAVAKLKSYVGMEGLHMLEFLSGAAGDKASLDEFLGTFVEAAVVDVRTVSASSTAGNAVVSLVNAANVAAAKLTGAPPLASKPATVNPT